MLLTRRTGLKLAAALLGTALIPAFAMGQNAEATSYTHTTDAGDVIIHPVDHASMVWETPAGVIYVDPVGGADAYADMPAPDFILITHQHGDHYDQPTLDGLAEAPMITNPAVFDMLPEAMQGRATSMANGDTGTILDYDIEATPAYNITEDRLQYHPEGRDNGYILTIGGKRFLIAGDTEDTPELRAMTDIEVAFLPMNLPYTMTVQQAADAVAAFKPKVVYPYHFNDSDVQEFARLVGETDAGTKVVIADWYHGATE
ncbi:MBL fold metallo-hydrolase [Paracoccus sp. JM45]|uniref:MBL fold metallo-hydrolase n=1 Tax=Paracoccus sp. JM45 TaxID=2283626 RepID=UPI000E6B8A2C|nr:MBL fold metallo-hydrolase [Paracoccus sp. JM45]RJE79377.1 MBL fold metallo-hydrolase [Paracoccus sp. JM45]